MKRVSFHVSQYIYLMMREDTVSLRRR